MQRYRWEIVYRQQVKRLASDAERTRRHSLKTLTRIGAVLISSQVSFALMYVDKSTQCQQIEVSRTLLCAVTKDMVWGEARTYKERYGEQIG
jgi:hypothetical protein